MIEETLASAVAAFIARRDRAAHPAGKTDKAGRWYPADEEEQPCCIAVREPSRSWPWSLMKHCRTAQHVANLHDVPVLAVRRAVRVASQPKRLGGDDYYKAVAVLTQPSGVIYVSIFDGQTVYTLGKTLVQRIGRGHKGGYYVYATAEDARQADVPLGSALLNTPRALLLVRAEGQYTRYPCGCGGCVDWRIEDGYPSGIPQPHPTKLAFSRITPLEVLQPQEVLS